MNNFIVGYAMGGNVALGTALMHPSLYKTFVKLALDELLPLIR